MSATLPWMAKPAARAFRFEAKDAELLRELAEEEGISQRAVLSMALREWALRRRRARAKKD